VSRDSAQVRQIELPDRDLLYTLKRSHRRKTIGLKVSEDGLTVTLPARVSVAEADAVVREKAGWVIDRLEKRQARTAPDLRGVDGELVGWLGSDLRLTVLPHDKARTTVTRTVAEVIVHVDRQLNPCDSRKAVLAALKRWRKAEALALMTPKLEGYAQALGAKRPKVSVREQKARWGSCSSDGSIRMNARLIAYPEGLVDYVCAHEACHLLVMDHSPRFHGLLDGLMPDQNRRRRALRDTRPAGGAF
jgi:predicted metal-dependent hydrolase